MRLLIITHEMTFVKPFLKLFCNFFIKRDFSTEKMAFFTVSMVENTRQKNRESDVRNSLCYNIYEGNFSAFSLFF